MDIQLGGAGSWTTEIKGAAAHGMLFVAKAPWEWNKVMAVDVETGEIIWEQTLTSNVWTCAIDPGDSILFVGTSIGIPPNEFPTFFAIDPFTGEIKWSKVMHTVEFTPIAVDTFIYASTIQADSVFAYTLKGNLIWKDRLTGLSPAYWDGKIYGGRLPFPWDPSDTLYLLYCRDALTGEPVWTWRAPSEIQRISIYDSKIYFFCRDTLFSISTLNGKPVWKAFYEGFHNAMITTYKGKAIFGWGEYGPGDTIFTVTYAHNIISGELVWRVEVPPREKDHGRATWRIGFPNDCIYFENRDYIYIITIKDGRVKERIELPVTNAIWSSWGFPIIYHNYYIGAHEDLVYVYRADTVYLPDSVSLDIVSICYDGKLKFIVSLAEPEAVQLKLYDMLGRLMAIPYSGFLSRGMHTIEYESRLAQGVYFIVLYVNDKQPAARKFVLIR